MSVGCQRQDLYFCQDTPGQCSTVLISEIDNASKSVYIAIAYFDHEEVAAAVIHAWKRGVDVRVVAEGSENTDNGTADLGDDGINFEVVQDLIEAGVPYKDDGPEDYYGPTLHHKFCIVDDNLVLSGSFNYTQKADTKNRENLMVFTARHVVDGFNGEFEAVWEQGVTP